MAFSGFNSPNRRGTILEFYSNPRIPQIVRLEIPVEFIVFNFKIETFCHKRLNIMLWRSALDAIVRSDWILNDGRKYFILFYTQESHVFTKFI